MLGQLVVAGGPDKGRAFPVAEGETLAIGRGENTATRLRDRLVSRVHCQVEVNQGKVVVVDSGSAGGTMVNGKRISRHELQPGDVVRVGETELRFVLDAIHEADTLVPAAQMAPKPGPRTAVTLADLVGKSLSHSRWEGCSPAAPPAWCFRRLTLRNNGL